MSNCDGRIGELAEFIEEQELPEKMPEMVKTEESRESWARMLLVKYRSNSEFNRLIGSLVCMKGTSNDRAKVSAIMEAFVCIAVCWDLVLDTARIAEAVAA